MLAHCQSRIVDIVIAHGPIGRVRLVETLASEFRAAEITPALDALLVAGVVHEAPQLRGGVALSVRPTDAAYHRAIAQTGGAR